MNYTILNLFACGFFGILVHTLIKINTINKKTNGHFKAGIFFQVEWASLLISICMVIVCLIARNEITQLKEVGNYLMLGFFFIGLGSQSLAYALSQKIEKRIDLENSGNNFSYKGVVVNEVNSLPDSGISGQWYHIVGNEYWYYADGKWSSVNNPLIGGGTVGTPK